VLGEGNLLLVKERHHESGCKQCLRAWKHGIVEIDVEAARKGDACLSGIRITRLPSELSPSSGEDPDGVFPGGLAMRAPASCRGRRGRDLGQAGDTT